jgi:large subunit ribosomal protein L5
LILQRLKSIYFNEVTRKLQAEFGYKNIHQIPKIKKVIINRGFDESCQNPKILEVLSNELTTISGQKVTISLSRKAIASFKLKEKMPVGMFVTLRGDKMYSFLDRLVNLALPRIRDFQGLSPTNFDGSGNYNLGLSEQLMFPEVDFDKVIKLQGMDICIVTTSRNDREAKFLLKELGLPFSN